MSRIQVNGKSYKVTENLGFNHSSGLCAKFVQADDGEKVVVKRGGVWMFWTSKDRLSGGPSGHPCGQDSKQEKVT